MIDNNGRRILDRGWGKLNPTLRHNFNQVRVLRLDKDGVSIEGRNRVCLNLSWVNKIFETFKHPIPDIQEIIQVLADSKFFSELDLSEAYNQLRISDELSQYMTFTCSFGKVSMEVVPFGVVFASDIFQSRICDEFLEFLDLFLVIYMDNLIVHTTTMEEHLDALRKVLSVCRKANLHLRKSKCLFMVDKLRTLGFIVSHNKIEPDPTKIEMLKKAPVPKTQKELKSFLGLLQFYRHMLPHLAHSVHRLYALTSSKVDFKWDSAADQA